HVGGVGSPEVARRPPQEGGSAAAERRGLDLRRLLLRHGLLGDLLVDVGKVGDQLFRLRANLDRAGGDPLEPACRREFVARAAHTDAWRASGTLEEVVALFQIAPEAV